MGAAVHQHGATAPELPRGSVNNDGQSMVDRPSFLLAPVAELVDAAGLVSVALLSEFAASNPGGGIDRMGTITRMAKKPSKPALDRVKFDGDWEDLAGRVGAPIPKKPPERETVKRPKKDACKHPALSKERIMGAQTGDYQCQDCRATFTPEQVKKMGQKS